MNNINEYQTNENANDFGGTVVFNHQKLKEMVSKIYDAERRNTKTKQRSDKAMKDLIEKIIEEVAHK